MPWWKQGSLTDEEAWQLTAFILRSDGLLPPGQELDIGQANFLPVHVPVRPIQDERDWQLVLLGAIGLAAVGLIGLRGLQTSLQTNSSNGSPNPGRAGPLDRAGRPEPAERPERTERPSFFHHLHPPTIPLVQARWRYTLGAGGLAVFLALILLITGILEMFFYVPTPDQAGPSIQTITYSVPFGALVRGIHFWAAQALVLVAVIHLLRVVLTGAYTLPRRFNYLLGVILLVTVLFLDFTGYVLRWDEGIRWALMVGTNLLKTIPLGGEALYGFVVGGESPGAAALNRFYAWHIFGLTLVLIVVVAWHVFRVRRDGGISAPPPELRPDPRRITRFELVRREVLAMLLASAGLILVATLIPAPIKPPIIDPPVVLVEEVRAPWFFLWVQQLLKLGNPFLFGVLVPLGAVLLLALLPYLPQRPIPAELGRWFPPGGRTVQVVVALLAVSIVILTLLAWVQ